MARGLGNDQEPVLVTHAQEEAIYLRVPAGAVVAEPPEAASTA